jgi:transposase
VIKLKAERDILKKAAVDSTGECNMMQVMFNSEDRRWRKSGGPACRGKRSRSFGRDGRPGSP